MHLHQQIHPLIASIKKAMLDIEGFDPNTTKRRFKIATLGYVEHLIFSKFCQLFYGAAPHAKLIIKYYDLFKNSEIFMKDIVELGVGLLEENTTGQLHQQLLFTERLVCIGFINNLYMSILTMDNSLKV